MRPPATATRRALTVVLLVSLAIPPARAQQDPPPAAVEPEPVVEEVITTSVLELSKMEEIIELLAISYAADLALRTAVRTAECTPAESNCAPLFFAQDVVLGPWNFVKLLRVTQELPDPDVATIVRPRDYETPALPPPGIVPPEIVSLAEYAFEQQVALYDTAQRSALTTSPPRPRSVARSTNIAPRHRQLRLASAPPRCNFWNGSHHSSVRSRR
jgi:hypothetical protein